MGWRRYSTEEQEAVRSCRRRVEVLKRYVGTSSRRRSSLSRLPLYPFLNGVLAGRDVA